MKWTVPAIAAAFVFGAAIGGAYSPTQPLKAAGMAPVYQIYEANITDADGYNNDFLKQLAPILEKHQAKFLARGGKTEFANRRPGQEPVCCQHVPEHGRTRSFLERVPRKCSRWVRNTRLECG